MLIVQETIVGTTEDEERCLKILFSSCHFFFFFVLAFLKRRTMSLETRVELLSILGRMGITREDYIGKFLKAIRRKNKREALQFLRTRKVDVNERDWVSFLFSFPFLDAFYLIG